MILENLEIFFNYVHVVCFCQEKVMFVQLLYKFHNEIFGVSVSDEE